MPKYLRFSLVIAFLLISANVVFPKALVAVNVIEGTVYDQNRNPVYNAFVELYDEVSALTGRTRTSTQGRFTFRGMNAGRYTIRVKPYGTNLLEDAQDIEVNNQNSQSDLVMVEFRLRIDKRITNLVPETPGEAIFVQDVSDRARKLYKIGVDKLDNKDMLGLKDIEAAIEIFPDYFDARSRLGREYVSRREFEKGYPHLLRAVDINQRCVSCYYSLGYAFYQLKQYPAASKAAMAAAVLDQSSVDVHVLLGTVLRLNGDYVTAEKALLKAKNLSKKPNPEIHWQLSLLYNKMKRNREAADELEAYLKVAPDSTDKQRIQELIGKLRAQK
jgi:tetratricopeptide (TPR) repeat protein